MYNVLDGLTKANHFVQQMAGRENGVHALLFYGAEGCGYENLISEAALNWLCKNPKEGLACGECQACGSYERGTNVDVLWVRPHGPSNWIKREMIHDDKPEDFIPVQSFVRTPPLMARNKLVIMLDVDRMNKDAANALLKTLEEPPAQAKFILATSKVGSVLPTIRSRCLLVQCELPSKGALSKEFTEDLIAMSQGAPAILEEIDAHRASYDKAKAWLEACLKAQPSEVLVLAEEAKELANKMEDTEKLAARYANVQLIERMARMLTPEMASREWGAQLALSHRRIQGNINPSFEWDRLVGALVFGF